MTATATTASTASGASASGAPAPASSVMLAALEAAWSAIRELHPDVPQVLVILASGSEGRKGLRLGHFAAARWHIGDDTDATLSEVMVGGEGLSRGAADVMGTLLHEAAHGLALARSIADTSRDGRFHNKRFARLAGELGLTAAKAGTIGYSDTAMTAETAGQYAAVIGDLAAALRLYRRAERAGATKKARNNLKCECGCAPARVLRVARKTLALGPIVCQLCDEEFRAIDDDQDGDSDDDPTGDQDGEEADSDG